MIMSRRLFMIGGMSSIITPAFAASKLQMSKKDHHILAQTVYGEARGEDTDGRYAVCNTIFNRVISNNPLFHKDKSITRACLRHKQYSCWDRGYISHFDGNSKSYKDILDLTFDAFHKFKKGLDNTKQATHYHTKNTHPDWVSDMNRTAIIDNHIFYKIKV